MDCFVACAPRNDDSVSEDFVGWAKARSAVPTVQHADQNGRARTGFLAL